MPDQQKIVVILNAPPGAGKDSAADYLQTELNFSFQRMMFKHPLYRIAAAIYNVNLKGFIQMASDTELKEQPHDLLGGKSPREVLIEVSEKVIKPVYGKRFFGEVAAGVIQNSEEDVFVFTDGGFSDELSPIIESDNTKVVVFRIHRDGCSYENDSRRYLKEEDLPSSVTFFDYENNLTVADIAFNIIYQIQEAQQHFNLNSKGE